MADRISPDNVVDLTLDDEQDNNSNVPTLGRRQELNSLRKKFRSQHPPNSSSSSQNRSNDGSRKALDYASSVASRGAGFQLTNINNDTNSRSHKKEQRKKPPPPAAGGEITSIQKTKRDRSTLKSSQPDNDDDDSVVEIMSGSDDSPKSSKNNSNNKKKKARLTGDDDCMVVDASIVASTRKMAPISNANATSDGDVQVVGTANEQKLPHMRQHCTECRFVQQSSAATNKENCDLCYCYVCDVLVKDCTNWSYHCHATDVGPRGVHWKKLRAQTASKNGNVAPTVAARAPAASISGVFDGLAAAIAAHRASMALAFGNRNSATQRTNPFAHINSTSNNNGSSAINRTTAARTSATTGNNRKNNQSLKDGAGPWPPTDAFAAADKNLTRCRKCGWFNRFFHRNFRHYQNLHPVGFLDWCHMCGRVANEKDFGKVQSERYVPQTGDIYLGERMVKFRIFTHDPRKMDKYAGGWINAANDDDDDEDSTTPPEWTYNEAEMKKDLFDHRFGKRPTPQMIVDSVPVVAYDKIPSTGAFHLQPQKEWHNPRKETMTTRQLEEENNYRVLCCPDSNKFHYWTDRVSWSNEPDLPSVDETEGIILDNPRDIYIFRELAAFVSTGTSSPLFDLKAKWDGRTQIGAFKLRLYLRPGGSMNAVSEARASFAKLLGAWYNVFPFVLADICGSLKADTGRPAGLHHRSGVSITVPPFQIKSHELAEINKNILSTATNDLKTHKSMVRSRLGRLTLKSSQKGSLLGGTCPPGLGFESAMRRFFSEVLADEIDSSAESGSWFDMAVGVKSTHRRMRKRGAPLHSDQPHLFTCHDISTFLRSEDVPIAVTGLRKASNNLFEHTTTIKGLIDHCENLGHAEVPFFEGLNVELLPFQRQSVQWALERETMEGGVQSLLWPKLPSVAQPHTEVYFNPILQSFRTDKPRLCRGGFIAEEMGLGKTVISLSLILINKAPLTPISGSSVTALDAIDNSSKETWDKDLYARTSGDNKKRGSVVTRGTLVVCNVSLVGQWISEAKSILKDSGMVYSYHGSSRKRDPLKLAQAAIVVTTYETLASDATFHARKDGNDDYCPPCEQLRWWRIILDESHNLRQASTKKSVAVMGLVSDHRWLVSGTPVSTSINDLTNQLKFLGIEHVGDYLKSFGRLMHHMKDHSARSARAGYSSRDQRLLGHFMFFMRALMIRHSQQQTYRGTSPPTTLMSLPPKTERVVEVAFAGDDRREYDKLESTALTSYATFRKGNVSNLGKHYLKLTQMLVPLRLACAGGPIPVEGQAEEDDENEGDDNDDTLPVVDEGAAGAASEDNKKKKTKTEVKYSDFSFRSKIAALIEELKTARDKDPTSKSLVFSQFASSLKHIQEELPKHGFEFRTLSGDMPMKKRAKALHDFQSDPPTTIFLLSMRAGACGINLTQANRVFLLEPCFNPALEHQALGRVHRLGQKRPVEVVRLIMKDSVETRMNTMLAAKYGTCKSDNKTENADGDEDTKMPATATAKITNTLVGSVATDKATILGREFDTLFGYTEGAEGLNDADDDGDEINNFVPDAVGSGKTTGLL